MAQTLIAAIRQAAAALDKLPEDRMRAYRELAHHVVDLRDTMDDMDGRSWHYRQVMAQCYAEAGVSGEARNRVQSAVRYHTGALIREAGKAPEHWLDQSPRERSAQRRADRAVAS